jgi:geranylgeranyl diphosphate synthase type II
MLQGYQKLIVSKIEENLPAFGPKSKLRDACEYALMNGGKRLRPAIVFMTAEALGFEVDVTQAALSIEYFHTASLVADDLPCMDDDDERRSKPSVHKAFGESEAILVSYALIAQCSGCLEKAATA